jgi:acetoin utilization deacetylase AcuC-like enzyme
LTVVYSARYRIDIGPHVFPTDKYPRVHARLLETGVIQPADVVALEPATWDERELVDTTEYLARLHDGTMSPEDVAQLELPWSAEMVEGFRLMTGGTIDAACLACGVARQDGTQRSQSTQRNQSSADSAGSAFKVACHIGGGLHHAFPNHGEGFGPFNDVAVSVRVLQGARVGSDRDRRPRRPPRKRDRVDLRIRSAGLHLHDRS